MHELASVPASVRQYIERADDLEAQGRTSEASLMLREVARMLAGTSPELCALLYATQLGYRSVSFSDATETSKTVRTQQTFFGIAIGEEIETTTTYSCHRKEFRLG